MRLLAILTHHFRSHEQTINWKVYNGTVSGLLQQLSPETHTLHVPTGTLDFSFAINKDPYGQVELGTSFLRLLSVLKPLTTLDPVINSGYLEVCRGTIPQLVKILCEHDVLTLKPEEWENEILKFSGKYFISVNNDDWLEWLNGSNTYFSDKTFLYKLFGFALWIVKTSGQEHGCLPSPNIT